LALKRFKARLRRFEMAAKAKVIVRTGAFDPWGNILLYSGVDVPAWFSKPGVVAPDYYAKKMKS
jgi:D-ribose pyranase